MTRFPFSFLSNFYSNFPITQKRPKRSTFLVSLYTHKQTNTHTLKLTHTRFYTSKHVHTNVHTYTHIHIHIHAHAQTHKHALFSLCKQPAQLWLQDKVHIYSFLGTVKVGYNEHSYD